MNYQIAPIDFSNARMHEEVLRLTNLVFDNKNSGDFVFRNTFTESRNSPPTLYLGAFENGELIGFNTFISHDLIRKGKIVNCYQSSWSAVYPQHRGRKIFVNIIEQAKIILKERKAGFIFGWPNENSRPIFAGILKFREADRQVKINIPAIRGFTSPFLAPWNQAEHFFTGNSYSQNDAQLVKVKKATHGSQNIIQESIYDNTLWGMKRKKKIAGLTLHYFSVGGLQVNNPVLLSKTIDYVFKNYRIQYMQFITNQTSDFVRLFKKPELLPDLEPLIVFDLNEETKTSTFNFMPGMRDTY